MKKGKRFLASVLALMVVMTLVIAATPLTASAADFVPVADITGIPETLTDISSISGMEVGDFVVNTGTATRTILGISTVIGGSEGYVCDSRNSHWEYLGSYRSSRRHRSGRA